MVRTSPFHGGNTGSNPVGDANRFKYLANAQPCACSERDAIVTFCELSGYLSAFTLLAGGWENRVMKTCIAALPLLLAPCFAIGLAQTPNESANGALRRSVQPRAATSSGERRVDSGPLTWITSDLNPKPCSGFKDGSCPSVIPRTSPKMMRK